MRGIAAILAALLAQSASNIPAFAGEVKSQTNSAASFERYRTYQWLPPIILTGTGIAEDHPVDPLVRGVVNRQLQLRGLTEVESGADLQVATWVVVAESIPKVEKALFKNGNVRATPIAAIGRDNHQGTFAVSLIDTRLKQSAWSAMAIENIPDRSVMKPDRARKKLEKSAEKLFENYPVKSKN
jgi:hypothetical protein